MIDNIKSKNDQKWFPCFYDYDAEEAEEQGQKEDQMNIEEIKSKQDVIYENISAMVKLI